MNAVAFLLICVNAQANMQIVAGLPDTQRRSLRECATPLHPNARGGGIERVPVRGSGSTRIIALGATVTKRREFWDWPATMRPRRGRRPQPLQGEILTPEPEPRIHRFEIVHHHRQHSTRPQQMVIAAALAILLLIIVRSPGALILLAVIIPAWFWLAIAVVVAVLVGLHCSW